MKLRWYQKSPEKTTEPGFEIVWSWRTFRYEPVEISRPATRYYKPKLQYFDESEGLWVDVPTVKEIGGSLDV